MEVNRINMKTFFFEYLRRVNYSIYVYYWKITKCNVFDIVFFVSFLRSSHEKIAQFSRVLPFYSNWVLLNYTWATKSAKYFNFYTLTDFFISFFSTNERNVTGFTYQSIFYDLKRFFFNHWNDLMYLRFSCRAKCWNIPIVAFYLSPLR